MCGRYLIEDEAYADILTILNDINAAKKRIDMDNIPDAGTLTVGDAAQSELLQGDFSRGEIFPTYIAPVINNDGVVAVKWGFPHWKNTSVIINARSETALEKNMFRKALRERRCVVPSSGFFEWGHKGGVPGGSMPGGGNMMIDGFPGNSGGSGSYSGRVALRRGGRKDKYLLRRPGEHMLFMGGMISTFRDSYGEEYDAFVILTVNANDFVAPIHDRMPLILTPDEIEAWTQDDVFMEFALRRPGPELSAVHVL